MSRKYIVLLATLAFFSLLFFLDTGGGLALIGMLTFIGMPLVFLMMYAPILLPVAAFAGVVHWLTTRFWTSLAAHVSSWIVGWASGAAIAVAVLSTIPVAPNLMLDRIVAELVAGDVDAPVSIGPSDTLAIVGGGQACGDLCQRLLLNDQVSAVIAVKTKDFTESARSTTPGTRYWFERRDACPDPELGRSGDDYGLSGSSNSFKGAAQALIPMRAATGLCLLNEPVTTARADAALVYGQIRNGISPYDAGFDLDADTVRAGRLSYYRREDGHLVLKFQKTAVKADKLTPILQFGYNSYYMSQHPGFQRVASFSGGASRYDVRPPLSPFLTDRLSLDLDVRDDSVADNRRDLVEKLLAGNDAIDVTNNKIVEGYLGSFVGSREIDESDIRLVMSILSERRIPADYYAYSVIRLILKQDPGTAPALAAAFFDRLFDEDSGAIDGKPQKQSARIGAVSVWISMLPVDAVLPYREPLERLAHERILRTYGARALPKLAAFGADAVPTLTHVIENSHRREGESLSHDFTGAYYAGWEGLCDMGISGKPALPWLHDYLDGRKIGYGLEHIALTLIALGDDPEEIWRHIRHNDVPNGRQFLDRIVAQAKRHIDCIW